ncbi:MAG: hypothetical protein JNK26_04165 [Candidatus Doudnabacteria bacterium]|nr:hypothetical protein [Candidatus Doudnabacteria bacterium]
MNLSNILGVPQVSGYPALLDIFLLDFPSQNSRLNRIWQNLIAGTNLIEVENILRNIRTCLIPQLDSHEITGHGISIDGQISRDTRDSPHSIFIQQYLKGLSAKKRILLILGHGWLDEFSDRKVVGSLSDYNNDLLSYLLVSIPLDRYSIVLDSTCGSDSVVLSPEEIPPSNTLIITPMCDVVLYGMSPTGLNSKCRIIHNGKASDFDWRRILDNRKEP